MRLHHKYPLFFRIVNLMDICRSPRWMYVYFNISLIILMPKKWAKKKSSICHRTLWRKWATWHLWNIYLTGMTRVEHRWTNVACEVRELTRKNANFAGNYDLLVKKKNLTGHILDWNARPRIFIESSSSSYEWRKWLLTVILNSEHHSTSTDNQNRSKMTTYMVSAVTFSAEWV